MKCGLQLQPTHGIVPLHDRVTAGERLCEFAFAPLRRHDVLQVAGEEIARGLPAGRMENLVANSDQLLSLPTRVDRGANLSDGGLSLTLLSQHFGEIRWRSGHLNHWDAVLVGGPFPTQAARG